jgi:AcrR family transcriptional regulator
VADLGEATGPQPGSIYAAFGSKAGLFKQVVDRYVATAFSYGPRGLEADSVREVVRRWLTGAATTATGETTPAGCLLVQGALVTGDGALEVGQDLCDRRKAAQVMLTERFARAQESGDLPSCVEPRVAARYVVVLAEGIAVEAASGASRETLLSLVDLTMRRLPWEA